MSAVLETLNARLRSDLGAGLDGPVYRRPQTILLTERERALAETTRALLDENRDTQAKATHLAGQVASETLKRTALEAAIEAERQRNAAAQEEQRKAAEAERLALARHSEELLAQVTREREEELTAYTLKLATAEALTRAERERADALEKSERAVTEALAKARRETRVVAAEPPKAYPVEMKPRFDRAGMLRSFTLKSPMQTCEVKVSRDAAGVPMFLEIIPR